MTIAVCVAHRRPSIKSSFLCDGLQEFKVHVVTHCISPQLSHALLAENPRDKALISVLYKNGCRIGEILTLKVRNVEVDANGVVLIVNGETGQRKVRLIHSVPRLMTSEESPLVSLPLQASVSILRTVSK